MDIKRTRQGDYRMVGVGEGASQPTVTTITGEQAEKLKQLRAAQYIKDRNDVLVTMSIQDWVVFCLRWGIAPPPNGFEDTETLLGLMHKIRLSLPQSNDIQKLSSAHYLSTHNIRLPGTFVLRDGVLTGSATGL